MIGRSALLFALRREALPFVVLAMLALVVQAFVAPLTASLAAAGEHSPFVLCVTAPDVSAEAKSSGGESSDRGGSCPCGPACPHASACSNLRGIAAAAPEVFDRTTASTNSVWVTVSLRPASLFGKSARAIRAPPAALDKTTA